MPALKPRRNDSKGETESDCRLAQHNLTLIGRHSGVIHLLQGCGGHSAIQWAAAAAFVFVNNPIAVWSVGIVGEDSDIRVPWSLTLYRTQTSSATTFRSLLWYADAVRHPQQHHITAEDCYVANTAGTHATNKRFLIY